MLLVNFKRSLSEQMNVRLTMTIVYFPLYLHFYCIYPLGYNNASQTNHELTMNS